MTAQEERTMTIPKQDERTPDAYLIEAPGGNWLQFTPEVAEADKPLVRVKPLYAYTSTEALRSALAEGRQAAVELASLMREGAHDKEEIKWCRVVDKIDAALSGSPAPSTEGLREELAKSEMGDDGSPIPFDTPEDAIAAGFTSGTLLNGDTFGDEDDPNPAHWIYEGRCGAEIFEAEIARMKSVTERLQTALAACIDDIVAEAVFEGTPKFEAERKPVVIAARTALAGVTAPSEVDAK